jgi:hypothetical protein
MAVAKQYQGDVDAILAKQRVNGGYYWATADGRWGVGSPFSTFDSCLMLTELGVPKSHPALKGAAATILEAWQEDGRIRPALKGRISMSHGQRGAGTLPPGIRPR